MGYTALRVLQVVAVIALLCVAAAVATPPGRLPLALRGLQKIIRKDLGEGTPSSPGCQGQQPSAPATASPTRRFVAFVLVLLAAVLAMI